MITSYTNQKVKRIVSYIQKNKARREDNVFIVEGMKMLVEVPKKNVREIYISESFSKNKKNEQDMQYIKLIGAEVEVVADDIFKKMADTQTPQGVMAVVSQFHYELADIIGHKNASKPLILVLENIQDPGNLGTMLRSSEGAGVSGIIMTRDTADIYNPKVVRSTMGSIFRVPFIYVENLPDTIRLLSQKGIKTYAAHLKGKHSYDKADYTGPTAFLIGNEGKGLSKEVADSADEYILIPMLGKVESMNAATSAALLTFEAARQRRG
ncbi:MAG: 23S rRNA (guanosine(2251)-2'-O)-methyltransferase RlmB [Lachnospiraceae bacterium]|nr:23S rRNA (guanosine(2251)-2'-O)-methyltransferase RlmB [Lachnospiraceae bacterium]MBQ7429544.1 23S rRNA (guanosine(2251)-2'-O)-methyltransferase RlmB [Butyrivibrio sp.]